MQTQFASAGIGVSYSGQSYQERVSSGDAALVFVLGLLIVFLVLAAQYESWSVPFAVLLGVPFGVLGALLGIWHSRTAQRRVLPGWHDRGGRARGEERDPDRGVRQRAAQRTAWRFTKRRSRRRANGCGRSS